MHLLYTICQRVTRCTSGVNEHLVVGILEFAQLSHAETEVDIAPASIDVHRIGYIHVSRAR